MEKLFLASLMVSAFCNSELSEMAGAGAEEMVEQARCTIEADCLVSSQHGPAITTAYGVCQYAPEVEQDPPQPLLAAGADCSRDGDCVKYCPPGCKTVNCDGGVCFYQC